MVKKEGFTEEVVHSNRNLVSTSNGALQVVSVAHGTFKKLAGKASSVSDVGRVANYVSACFKKKNYTPKCDKCQDVGHFSVVGHTPNGEYTFGVPCECSHIAGTVMHSGEYEKMTRTVLSNKKETV
jgi:hypothetical protein